MDEPQGYGHLSSDSEASARAERSAAPARPRHGAGILERLAGVTLFRALADRPEDLQRIVGIIEVRKYPAGTRIIEENQEGQEMYIINQGRVQVLKRTLYNDEYTVANLDAGHFFGEIGLMDQDRRSATVAAEVDCELLVLRRDRFIELGDRFPQIGLLVTREIAQSLCRRLRRANDDTITLFGALVQQVEQEMQGHSA